MPPEAPEPHPKPTLSPTALSLADAVKVLNKAGGAAVTLEMLQRDIDAGAPLNADGTLSLVAYAAWLVREMALGN